MEALTELAISVFSKWYCKQVFTNAVYIWVLYVATQKCERGSRGGWRGSWLGEGGGHEPLLDLGHPLHDQSWPQFQICERRDQKILP
jgi:hypothetical protein